MLEIFVFLQKQINLERKTQHAFITNANTSNGIIFFFIFVLKKVGDDVIRPYQYPFKGVRSRFHI